MIGDEVTIARHTACSMSQFFVTEFQVPARVQLHIFARRRRQLKSATRCDLDAVLTGRILNVQGTCRLSLNIFAFQPLGFHFAHDLWGEDLCAGLSRT